MEQLLILIPALACPIGMGVCMWLMGRHMHGSEKSAEPTPADSARDRESGATAERL
jgi:hypothetical protein